MVESSARILEKNATITGYLTSSIVRLLEGHGSYIDDFLVRGNLASKLVAS
jgi:hypothetical protein